MHKFDAVDVFAVLLLMIGIVIMASGIYLDPPGSPRQLFVDHFPDWTPGFAIDALLLLVLNRVIHNHERKRVISQAASLSNEFALDAVRRCRDEGWLCDGRMEGGRFSKARLATADFSEARLARSDFSFADLSGADLTHVDLCGSDLTGANLSGCDLRWSDLSRCDLSWADLRGAQLDGAALEDVRTYFASIDPDHLDLAAFEGAIVGGLLSADQTGLVKAGLAQLLAQGDAPVVRFYEKLFEAAPQLRGLFSSDLDRQARKFLQSLKLIVSALSSTEKCAPLLQRLGQRHEGYGVKAEHYDVVGHVLVDTLDEALGDTFTQEMRVAWTAAFDLIASLMRGGSSQTCDHGGAIAPISHPKRKGTDWWSLTIRRIPSVSSGR